MKRGEARMGLRMRKVEEGGKRRGEGWGGD